MGSRSERAHRDLVHRLLKWPGVRERPEGADPFGASCCHPTLRHNGARLLSFHKEGTRIFAALHLPPSLAAEFPEAEPALAGGAEEGRAEAWIDLGEKGGFERALEIAARVYEVRTGRPAPTA